MGAEPFVLELSSCTVRDWKRGDEPSIVRHANNRNVWLGLRDIFPHPYTTSDARSWVRTAMRVLYGQVFAIEVGGFAVGGIDLRPDTGVNRFNAEIEFWLGEEYWGRGIATEAVVAVTQFGFEENGYKRIYAQIFEGNAASVRVLEKAGYTLEGRLRASAFKDNRFVDQILYARTSSIPHNAIPQ
ncbi:MAG: GNAT family N-acetyltransferase [Candidatus Krumholzibacteriota bacterium]|nr:GNAT family N-acetyltransferase [Candidatus Krumholzibacteriota bacterium]